VQWNSRKQAKTKKKKATNMSISARVAKINAGWQEFGQNSPNSKQMDKWQLSNFKTQPTNPSQIVRENHNHKKNTSAPKAGQGPNSGW
jgi:hypothetical protein